ncbi:lipoprotein lipase-like isoform X1 [Atheta coriaria]|uniref:lipoprotein lipase-like isoform X1 n=1 Tax=Dalotia coriaria TaxID=877792 RepID=UPI0031F38CEF
MYLIFGAIFSTIFRLSPEADAHLVHHDYPQDDYASAVDFSLAATITKDHLKFVHFNDSGDEVDANQLENYPTKVLIHGWLTSIEKSPWYPLLKDAYLKEPTPINIIYVDYEPIAGKQYSVSAPSSLNVARVIADHLITAKIDMDNIHLIGHSLGSHVAGFTGRSIYTTTGKKVGRITLLDPAGPKFEKTPNITNTNDATFLDVIHTDDGHYGFQRSIGHLDVFPNGGGFQPGCPHHDVDDNCSHARSTRYFVESIGRKPRIGQLAASWEDFQAGNYTDSELYVFGEHVPHTLRGNMYFKTNTESPFLTE